MFTKYTCTYIYNKGLIQPCIKSFHTLLKKMDKRSEHIYFNQDGFIKNRKRWTVSLFNKEMQIKSPARHFCIFVKTVQHPGVQRVMEELELISTSGRYVDIN